MKVKYVDESSMNRQNISEEYHAETYLSIRKVSGHLNFFLLADI
jgi:hypothetical protein